VHSAFTHPGADPHFDVTDGSSWWSFIFEEAVIPGCDVPRVVLTALLLQQKLLYIIDEYPRLTSVTMDLYRLLVDSTSDIFTHWVVQLAHNVSFISNAALLQTAGQIGVSSNSMRIENP
jgi:hypothetical protein